MQSYNLFGSGDGLGIGLGMQLASAQAQAQAAAAAQLACGGGGVLGAAPTHSGTTEDAGGSMLGAGASQGFSITKSPLQCFNGRLKMPRSSIASEAIQEGTQASSHDSSLDVG